MSESPATPEPVAGDGAALVVSDAPERQRYEGRIGADGQLAAVLTYELEDTRITLQHTEVLEAFEGQGIGSGLVREVLADARARGLGVVARCPFVIAWLERHPGDQDVLVEPLRGGDRPGS